MLKAILLGSLLCVPAFASDPVIGEYVGTLTVDTEMNTPGFPTAKDHGTCSAAYNISFDGRWFNNDIASVNCGSFGAFSEGHHWVVEENRVFTMNPNGSANYAVGPIGYYTNGTITAQLAATGFFDYWEKSCDGAVKKTLNTSRMTTYTFKQNGNSWNISRNVEVRTPYYVQRSVTCADGRTYRFQGYELTHDFYNLQGVVSR